MYRRAGWSAQAGSPLMRFFSIPTDQKTEVPSPLYSLPAGMEADVQSGTFPLKTDDSSSPLRITKYLKYGQIDTGAARDLQHFAGRCTQVCHWSSSGVKQ